LTVNKCKQRIINLKIVDNKQVEVFPCPHREGIEEEYRYSCTHS